MTLADPIPHSGKDLPQSGRVLPFAPGNAEGLPDQEDGAVEQKLEIGFGASGDEVEMSPAGTGLAGTGLAITGQSGAATAQHMSHVSPAGDASKPIGEDALGEDALFAEGLGGPDREGSGELLVWALPADPEQSLALPADKSAPPSTNAAATVSRPGKGALAQIGAITASQPPSQSFLSQSMDAEAGAQGQAQAEAEPPSGSSAHGSTAAVAAPTAASASATSIPAPITAPSPSPATPAPVATTPNPSAASAQMLEQVTQQVADAREAGRGLRPELTVKHAEFGAVSMRMEPGAGGAVSDWRATLSARDPEFVPAVQAALTERGVIAASESGFSQTGSSQRGLDQNPQSGSQNSAGSGGANSASDQSYGSSRGGDKGSAQPYSGEEGDGGSNQTAAASGDANSSLAGDAHRGAVFA
ncbi:MAG: hypothetical protein AAFQ90_00560 [Pseudomonadota bacterium]